MQNANAKKLRDVDDTDTEFGGGDDEDDFVEVQKVSIACGSIKISVLGIGSLDEVAAKALELYVAVHERPDRG